MRASLPFVIDWMKQIDAWHEFKFSDRQLQTISPEFQQYGETVLNNTLNLKTMDRKSQQNCVDVQRTTSSTLCR